MGWIADQADCWQLGGGMLAHEADLFIDAAARLVGVCLRRSGLRKFG